MRLYTMYVRPHLEFATPAWAPWQEGDIDCLERVQQRAVGMVSGLRGRTYMEKLDELNMETLSERRHQRDMQQTFRILHGIDKVNSEDWFKMGSDSERVTRATADPLNMRTARVRLEVRKHFFTQRIQEKWNAIPTNLKNLNTANSFKNSYRRYRRGEDALDTAT